jgi:hypothetical protein
VHYYLSAKRAVLEAGFGHEIVWQATRMPDSVTETEFLTEAAWVIMSSGLSERIVRSRFSMVAAAFFDFVSADKIAANANGCCASALAAFRHAGKIDAIAKCATHIAEQGYDSFYSNVLRDPLRELQAIPYIGPVTALHLAKNMGVVVCKPDRHLSRTAATFGMAVDTLCQAIASWVGDDVRVVDIVLWRYAVIRQARGSET